MVPSLSNLSFQMFIALQGGTYWWHVGGNLVAGNGFRHLIPIVWNISQKPVLHTKTIILGKQMAAAAGPS